MTNKTKKDFLITLTDFLQENDVNGTYSEIIEEVENEELTVDEGIEECQEILQRWLEEESPQDKELKSIIKACEVFIR